MVTPLSELIAFALFALVTVGSSVGVVLVEDVWHAALLLGVALFGVAVLVLVTFAVMLVREEDDDVEPPTEDADDVPPAGEGVEA
ncbi:short chain dehydrogenase [Halobacteriales archaeon SW_5_70_135]|nr:MAG: short chain dehydrogenase [Halobacteriales archaeon SW_5_70_135]